MMQPHQYMPQLSQLPIPWDPSQAKALIAQLNGENYPAEYPADVTATLKAKNPLINDTLLRRQYLGPGVLAGLPAGAKTAGQAEVHDQAFADPQGSDVLRALRATFGLL